MSQPPISFLILTFSEEVSVVDELSIWSAAHPVKDDVKVQFAYACRKRNEIEKEFSLKLWKNDSGRKDAFAPVVEKMK